MIYVFGDLRQLRKFELSRPTISRPMPMPISSPMASRPRHARRQSFLVPSRSAPAPEKSIGTSPPASSSLDSPTSVVSPTRPYAQFSSASLARMSCESCESVACSSAGCNEIDVSPAFFDDMPAPEGPATASCLHRPEYRLPPSSLVYLEPAHTRPEPRPGRMMTRTPTAGSPVVVNPSQGTRSPRSRSEYGPTAGFIPTGYSNNSTTSLGDTARSLRSQRSACYFDFDALPPNRANQRRDSTSEVDNGSLRARRTNASVPPLSTVVVDSPSPHASAPASSSSPTLGGVGHFFGRAQYKCNQPTSPAFTSPHRNKDHDVSSFDTDTSSTDHPPKWYSFAALIPSFTAGVPAFAAPLTQVQSPVVKRAQWEVVVRAAVVAVLIAGTLTGIVVGLVP